MTHHDHKTILYETRIDFGKGIRRKVVDLLNQTLASALDLKTQVKQAHWNVKGLQFYQLHELFDSMAGELEEYVDMLAERVTALGGTAMGTARMAASHSRLPEYPVDALDGLEHIVCLSDRYAVFGRELRTNIEKTAGLGDADTSDLYTEVSRAVDKRLWFLEAHLQAPVAQAAGKGNTKRLVKVK
jgi:starvation-inducible DNA-binding protein